MVVGTNDKFLWGCRTAGAQILQSEPKLGGNGQKVNYVKLGFHKIVFLSHDMGPGMETE